MIDLDGSPFPPHVRDDFDEWFRAPVPLVSPDPRIEVRRALPSEFERIYDLVDEAFGFKRSRALNDWAYRHNPYGVARCWISVERATGKFVGSAVNWLWPLAHGMRPLPATQGGDAAVAHGWQRRQIHGQAGEIRESHPWMRSNVFYGWPNASTVQRIRKDKKDHRLVGVVPRRVLPLRTGKYLAGRGLPRPLAAVGGRIVDGLFATWSAAILGKPIDGRVEQVRRFDSAFDDVTRRCLAFSGYWCPHDADFLNWRYFRDPAREHVAFALTVGATLSGYAVVRVDGGKALLMEFVIPHEQPRAAHTLLLHVIESAVDAGCSHVVVTAPSAWRHWRLLRSAGFVAQGSGPLMYAFSWRDDTPGLQAFDNWQFLGGDLDPFVM
ncbi:MAG: hypothetical protein HYR72_14495 [Deltaproteobacteria bacterium]|nr:hypothetical protein [Deltaproteobacteria bacterium]MBI3389974.1 hypothetical protein [Deltaproteobacteria bacterium]